MPMLEEPIAAPLKESNTDLALVLAVDSSSSVDDIEFAIQLRGIASAFRQVAIVEAIKSGPNGRIDVVLLVWSGEIEQSDRSEWTRIVAKAKPSTSQIRSNRSRGAFAARPASAMRSWLRWRYCASVRATPVGFPSTSLGTAEKPSFRTSIRQISHCTRGGAVNRDEVRHYN